ncbi:MAG TPA: aminopeptidase P family protein [Thermoleophilaceae bacterium]|nr:aminopeptidase P family protein [Thermoleophilaceae bacterium]
MTDTPAVAAPAIAAELERRRRAAAERWELADQVVLIGAGNRIPVPGRGDRTYPFRAHSEYLYLTDRERPGGVLAFDPHEGWADFVMPVTREERLWEGAATDEPEGVPVGEFAAWLEQRKDRPVACLGAAVPEVASAAELEADLRYGLNHVRRQKDAVELARMRAAERATSAGFAAVAPLIEPGRSERELQIELEAAFFRGGADSLAFDTIIGSGPNSAVLHFPPTSRRVADGELVLIDAGGEYRGYASDITRTYPASGRFTPEQQELYAIVAAAAVRATELCTAGTEWRDVHRAAALVVAEGLVEFGLLRGGPESLVERGSQALFFPHGVGHMVGLGVRDAGEVLRGRESAEDEFPHLRVDLPLLPGHVFTVEPGIYFVPALLNDADLRERHRDAVDWERAEAMLGFGGIRIENNVLITEDGNEVLTADVPLLAEPAARPM